jgi:hypothetical protein
MRRLPPGLQAHDDEEIRMTQSGQVDPDPDGSGELDCTELPGPAVLDAVDLGQPDTEFDALLREITPGARLDTPKARAAQIEVDRRIVARVEAENFDGPNTKKLLLHAFDYATPVMGYLIGTGRIYGQCKRLRRPVRRQPGDGAWTQEDCHFLTEACVDAGIFHVFPEHGLKKGRWDPQRGTSLATYAVNACILCFSSVYQKWWRGRVLERSFGDLATDIPQYLQADMRQPDPADRVVNRIEAERLLLEIPEPARTALWLRGVDGATQAEAASYVGMSEKALESRIGRVRVRLGLTRDSPPKPPGTEPCPDQNPSSTHRRGDCDR